MNHKPVCSDCACQYTFFLCQGTFRPSDLTLSTIHWLLCLRKIKLINKWLRESLNECRQTKDFLFMLNQFNIL
jgi:hypothetical protein